MQLIVVIGVIAALIYYILKMRASAKSGDEDSENADEEGFMDDMFISSNERASTYSDKNASRDKERGGEKPGDKLLLGDPYGDLEKLAALYEKGILTQDEYSVKKKEILERI